MVEGSVFMSESKHTYENMTKSEQRAIVKDWKSKLAKLQQPLRESGIPVIVLFEGFSGAGKGTIIGDVISELDPRHYTVHTIPKATEEEKRLPFLAPFWHKLPPKGEMAIFDHSWYSRAQNLPKEQQAQAFQSILLMERQLADDGYLILKFFLHISQKEQEKRLKALAADPNNGWRVDRQDWRQNRKYKKFEAKVTQNMEASSKPYAPWHLVDNNASRIGTIQVIKTLHEALEHAIEQGIEPRENAPYLDVFPLPMPDLEDISLECRLDNSTYEEEIKVERESLRQLHSALYLHKIPVILAFEGWDAAGKGGAIRRLSWALDPRGFNVIPIASPSREELNRHYLWRFWNKIPKDGHIAIFDRTWYGRVMVERLEELTAEARWQQAYQEINEFEEELTKWGAIVLKFWIHIDKDEQLSRFTSRQNTPEKQHKLTDEDWRNREKWDDYEIAVNEMLQKTSTQNAPWIVVEGNDKRYARLKVLQCVRQALEERFMQENIEL